MNKKFTVQSSPKAIPTIVAGQSDYMARIWRTADLPRMGKRIKRGRFHFNSEHIILRCGVDGLRRFEKGTSVVQPGPRNAVKPIAAMAREASSASAGSAWSSGKNTAAAGMTIEASAKTTGDVGSEDLDLT